MPFITQTPISDQIQNGQLPSSYSKYDTNGNKWDSLKNYDTKLNIKPSNGINSKTYSAYDTVGKRPTWSVPSSVASEYANIVPENKIPLIDDTTTKIDLTTYFSDNYKNSGLYTNTSLKEVLLQASINAVAGRIGSGINQSANRIPTMTDNTFGQFETLDYDQLQKAPAAGLLQDFRQFKKSKNIRLDGASTSLTSPSKAAIKLVTANAVGAIGAGGAYQLFDRETYFGMGDLGETTALRKDFTVSTEAATTWIGGNWRPRLTTQAIPFRGDKVNVRDFGQGTEKEVYKWKRGLLDSDGAFGIIGQIVQTVTSFIGTPINTTRDFIKFHFLGPITGQSDQYDIFTFRAAISSLTDSFSPQWTPIDMIGRADKNYIYTSFSRTVNLSFSVYASSRDELKPMWRKLNYLATYTMPEYQNDYVMFKGKYLRVTIGDLFIKQPAFILDLTYTLVDNDTTWEINIEEDSTIKQVPHRVEITMTLQMLTDHLPQYKGQAYSLYDAEKGNVPGTHNWLSDSVTAQSITDTLEAVKRGEILGAGRGENLNLNRGQGLLSPRGVQVGA